MLKIPLSGGPHTGKTTLLNALKNEFPDATFVEEPAELVIAEELRKEEAAEDYAGIYPWGNYPSFARLAVDKSLELEVAVPEDASNVFLDRSLIDNIGYGKLNGYEDLIPGIRRHILAARYSIAFFCEPVGEYTKTLIRREDPKKAQALHEHLSAAYEESGIEVVHLPAVPVPGRVAIIRDELARIGLHAPYESEV